MAVRTIYKCDKCGAEKESGEQFWTVGVSANMATYSREYFISDKFQMQVCRPCLESLGIYVQEKTKEDPAHNPPTLEELIREVVTRCVDIPQ